MRSTTADQNKKERSEEKDISISPFSHSSKTGKIKISVANLMKNKRKVKSSLCTFR